MFEAKKNRLDECVAYNDVIGSRHQEKDETSGRVSDAIGQSSFRMVYQPIVDARDSSLFGIEALVRWRVRDEEVPAAEIVALAEAAKQTGVLGR